MQLLKTVCVVIAVSLTLGGCGSSTGSDGNGGDNGSGGDSEPTQYSFSASPSPSEGGSVDPTSGTFDEGSEVTVEATSNNGWAFSDWSGDISSQDNPLTFTINEDTDLTANFDDERSMYTVEMIATNQQDTVKNLSIGQAQGAVEGFDSMDEESPPPPPPGALGAFFEINDLDLYKDFRSNLKKQVQWSLKYQVDSGDDFKLDWTIADDTQSPGTLVLTDQSDSFEVDMFNNNTHTVSGSTSGTLIIEYSFN